jgi:hypothetical protein
MKWKMDLGLGAIHQQHKENLINIITSFWSKRNIVSEAELNRILARIKDTTERFNGILIQSDPPSS